MSNKDDLLISQLISETYQEQMDEDAPQTAIDLRNYFEKMVNEVEFLSLADYVKQHDLSNHDLAYIEETGCFKMFLETLELDFPSNWSVFREIRNKEMIYLDASLDQDYLIDLFEEVTGIHANLAFVTDAGQTKLIFLSGMKCKDHLAWIRGYLEKQNTQIDIYKKEAA